MAGSTKRCAAPSVETWPGGSPRSGSHDLRRRRSARASALVMASMLAILWSGCQSDLEEAQDPSISSARLSELAVSEDPAVQLAVANHPAVTAEHLYSLVTRGDSQVKFAVLRREELSDQVWSQLRTDQDKAVRLAVVGHPHLPTSQILGIAQSGDVAMKSALLDRPSLAPEVLGLLAGDQHPEVRRAVAGLHAVDRLTGGPSDESRAAGHAALLSDLLRDLAADESQVVRTAVAQNPLVSGDTLQRLALDPDPLVRATVAANSTTPPLTLFQMLESGELAVRMAVAGNPAIGPKTARRLSGDPAEEVRQRIATNPATPVSVLNAMARGDESWDVQESARRQGSTLPTIVLDLVRAQRAGLVTARGQGSGLQRLELELKLEVVQPVRVIVERGTIFRPNLAGTQAMVLRESFQVKLTSERPEIRLTLDAACAEMHDAVPGQGDEFTVQAPPSGDLAKLLTAVGFHQSGFRVQQFAIWTITDDPSRRGYVGLGSFGFGSGPSDEEMKEIRRLFLQAGISPSKYRAFD